MKTVFNIFIFLAITAFTLDVVSTFVTKNATEELSKVNDSDEEPDSDNDSPCDSDGEEEEGEETVKGLFFEQVMPVSVTLAAAGTKDYFREADDFRELHLVAPPYSPPELA